MGQRGVIHNFDEDNEWSQSPEIQPFLNRFYLSAFPKMRCQKFVTNKEQQRAGIDRIVTMLDGEVVYIDEKIRENYYPDILIEYGHTNGMPGWMNKDLDIDYIAYVWLDKHQGYLIKWEHLTRAWILCGQSWKEKYSIPPSKNENYDTFNIAVPINVLKSVVEMQFIKV